MKGKIKYELAMDRLEKITKDLEKGDLVLDEALALFEEGISLTRASAALLDEAEGRIKVLIKEANGSINFKDYHEVTED